METKGYIKGSPDGAFHPTEAISRSEVVTLLDNAVSDMVTNDSTISDESGKTVIVNTKDVVLKDSVIKGDLILSEGVDEGDVTLQNVTVQGKLMIRGGGINSVKIENSNINAVSVEKKKSSVRLLSENSDIAAVDVTTTAILDGTFQNVSVSAPVNVTVAGNVTDMSITAAANIEATGSIDSVKIEQGAEGTVVKGNGSVNNINIAAEQVSIETNQSNVTVAAGISQAMVNGEAVTGGTQSNTENKNTSSNNNRPSGGGSSGGGSQGGTITQEPTAIEKITPVTNGLLRVTLNKATKEALTKEDFSIICTGAGSDMTILRVSTSDNKVYDLTTAYYKDDTYNIQVKLGENKYLQRDFEIKYDCAELSSESVKRTEKTMAEFTYVSDTPGTLYYGLVKKEPQSAAKSLLTQMAGNKSEMKLDTAVLRPRTAGYSIGQKQYYALTRSLFTEMPTVEELIANGTATEMKVRMNTVNITGLEPDTAYTLYYAAVDVEDRVTLVKEIEIAAEAIEKPPVISDPDVIQYNITSIESYKDVKAEEGRKYWYEVTFDKAVEEALTTEKFTLTCPAQSDLHLGDIEKVNDTTYRVYMKAGSIPMSGNTFTMTVSFENGTSCEKTFYFDVGVPIVDIVEVKPTSENTIDVELSSNDSGYLYYKVYDDGDQFGDVSAKDPTDIYETGIKKEISYGTNILTDIEAKEGQRFCYATENENGSKDSTFYYSKPIGKYVETPDDTPDEDALEIASIDVISNNEIDVHFNKNFEEALGVADYYFDDSTIDISNVSGRPSYSVYKKDDTTLNISIFNGVTFIDGEHILTLTLPDGAGNLRATFETGTTTQTQSEAITQNTMATNQYVATGLQNTITEAANQELATEETKQNAVTEGLNGTAETTGQDAVTEGLNGTAEKTGQNAATEGLNGTAGKTEQNAVTEG